MEALHPFRFAVQASSARDPSEWRSLARRAEDLGYSTLYVPDHFDDQWGPIVALSVAAEATSQLNVGSLVFDNDYRHPAVLAKEIATLDLVSGGRVEVGLGAGWLRSDYEQLGLAYDSPGVRIERMTEGLQVMKALWANAEASFHGSHYDLNGARGLPRPYSQPHPRVVIGGGSRKILSIAAREADVVGVNLKLAAGYVGEEVISTASPAHYMERIDWVREAAGDRFSEIELQCLTFAVKVGPATSEYLDLIATTVSMPPEMVRTSPLALIGSVDEVIDVLQARRQEFGFSYWVVHAAEIDEFAPVVERLAGV
ncbi:MAG: TIGR03621 family F420-dependent LLM class oxidoreductase [Actinomycetota bacterium]|nr:TIGR03621 family F420-dependent LLM class oxidoreductase [Actinomycetota bacterium]